MAEDPYVGRFESLDVEGKPVGYKKGGHLKPRVVSVKSERRAKAERVTKRISRGAKRIIGKLEEMEKKAPKRRGFGETESVLFGGMKQPKRARRKTKKLKKENRKRRQSKPASPNKYNPITGRFY